MNLRGAFDHATDVNDQPVIERRGRVLKPRRFQGGKIAWVAVEGDGEEEGSKDESEIIIISAVMYFPSLGFDCVTRSDSRIIAATMCYSLMRTS